MLPAQKRLSIALFKEVIDKGKSLHSPLFILRIVKTGSSGTSAAASRFSVSVPKKIGKTAVIRNKMRRRFYSALKPLYSDMHSGVHGVFIAKLPALDASFGELSEELKNFFGKSGLLK